MMFMAVRVHARMHMFVSFCVPVCAFVCVCGRVHG